LNKRNGALLNPAAPDVWLFLGTPHYNRQDWNRACKLFERAWISDTNVDAAALFLSKALHRAEGPKEASLAIHRHLETRPPSAPLLIQLGYTQLGIQEFTLALTTFERARALGENTSELQSGIGQGHYQMARYDAAMDAFSHAIRLDPTDQSARVFLARCYLRRGDLVAARQQCLAVRLDGKPKSIADEILRTIQRIEDGGDKRPAAKWPRANRLFDDLRQLARDFVLTEVDPSSINLDADKKVVALGSCFAENLAKELSASGIATEHIGFAEILNSTYANRYFLDWLYETGDASEHYKDFSTYFSNLDKVATRKIFDEADLFVYTLGVAPCLFESESGRFIFHADDTEISMQGLSKRYNFRTTTVDENFDNMQAVAQILLENKPQARLVYTVSPVPLNASFEYNSAVVADCVSKSILRAAADLLARKNDPRLVYWPSFEIVRWLGAHVPVRSFGDDDGNSRHVNRELVRLIVELFVDTFGDSGLTRTISNRPDTPSIANDAMD
jgi:tetratricopeptide (TPR) repeat protein